MLKKITASLITSLLRPMVDILLSNPEYLTYSRPKLMALILSQVLDVKLRILVTGDRNWTDKAFMKRVLLDFDPNTTVLVHGNCKGADILAGEVATELGMEVEVYPANWKRYNRAAGPIRNLEMLHTKPHLIMVWHDNLAQSRGTKNCVEAAKKLGYTSRLEYYTH